MTRAGSSKAWVGPSGEPILQKSIGRISSKTWISLYVNDFLLYVKLNVEKTEAGGPVERPPTGLCTRNMFPGLLLDVPTEGRHTGPAQVVAPVQNHPTRIFSTLRA